MREPAIVETVTTVPGRRNRRLSMITWADLPVAVKVNEACTSVRAARWRRGGQPNIEAI